ncbi:MAG: NUDIX domain-containing protein [Sediminibacterium sp.]|nr:NUDIX domain-containing protein [Sediminibacterium sp.]
MNYKNEEILVVPRQSILPIVAESHGFIQHQGSYDFILNSQLFIKRQQAEVDVNFKQIIPYIVIKSKNKFLCYSRTKNQSEQRLHNLYSIGIGGHINPNDQHPHNANIIWQGLQRELNEEIHIKLLDSPQFKGFINDDLTEVGKVHLGLLFFAESIDDKFEVKEKDKIIAQWMTRQELHTIHDRMESWSQIALQCIN